MNELRTWLGEEIDSTRSEIESGLNNRQKCFQQGRLDALEQVEELLEEMEEELR